jgi:hypothetical protein
VGVRIVVVLQQDLAHIWASDPKLGVKILAQALGAGVIPEYEVDGCKVAHVSNDNTTSLVVISGCTDVQTLASSHHAGRPRQVTLGLLRQAARNLGNALVRIPYWRNNER